MPKRMPAVSLVAVPGRRGATLELAGEIEKRGFSGIYSPSMLDALSLCQALAFATKHIRFGTAVMPIYFRQPTDFANTTAFIHEISGGRFRFGIGVSHTPSLARMGVSGGKPLSDMRDFIEKYRDAPRTGDKPPVVVAGLRKKMIALAGELGDGLVFANGALSHMPESLSMLPAAKRKSDSFFIGNMLPTCISDNVEAAKAVSRRTLTHYLELPNYRNYWREAGYVEEIDAVEKAIQAGENAKISAMMGDRWLDDVTLFGSATRVRDRLEAWYDAGIHTPILVPSSVEGNQLKAFEEIMTTFAG
jgi:alkanesulfonate monooxygenase SsuD/methylene tetrahydromethanopterin reductase-like flavin-dependent oxidoreductase (luciferase family)